MSATEVAEIAPLCTTRLYNEGETVLRQGERCDTIYIIVKGEIGIFRQIQRGGEMAIALLGPGRAFGWSSLIRPPITVASARVVKEGESILVDAIGLRFLMENNLSIGLAVMWSLAELLAGRLRATYATLDTSLDVWKPAAKP